MRSCPPATPPRRRTAIIIRLESKKHPSEGAFWSYYVFGDLLLAFSPSALPFPGSGRNMRSLSATPSHRS